MYALLHTTQFDRLFLSLSWMEGLPQANDDEISRLRRKIEERRRDLKELEQQLQALTQAEEVKEPKPKKAKLEPAIAVDAAAASQVAAAGPSNSGNVPSLGPSLDRNLVGGATSVGSCALVDASKDAEEADEAGTPAASKFFEDGEGSLKFGEISTFYEGLDGFLGPPNPNLREAMENEHCKSADATAIFRVPNYYTHTTSELEYWFVVEPTQEKLEELRFVRSSSDLPACLPHPISE